jgi:hypothetical protein
LKTHLHKLRKRLRAGQHDQLFSDNSVVNSGDDSVVNQSSRDGDDSGVNEPAGLKVQRGDDSVVNGIKSLKGEPVVFHSLLWKSLWKSPLSAPQTTEIYGLLADCTKFVQSSVTRSTSIITLFTGKNLKILGLFCHISPTAYGIC